MNNQLPDLKEYRPFPSIKQCWIMVLIIFGMSFAASPITIASKIVPSQFFKDSTFFLTYLISFGGASFLIYLYKKGTEKEYYKHPQLKIKDWLLIPLIIIATIALQIGVSIPLISLIPIPDFIAKIFDDFGKEMNNPWGIISVVVLAPLLEEYLFRGVMLDGLLKRVSPTKAILYSSLFFGLIHLNPWQFVSAMVIGCFAGWIYYNTKNLALAIVVHFANNGWATLSQMLTKTSSAEPQSLNPLYIIISLVVATICIYFLYQRLQSQNIVDSSLEQVE